jgi:hypothetical protein
MEVRLRAFRADERGGGSTKRTAECKLGTRSFRRVCRVFCEKSADVVFLTAIVLVGPQ